MSSSTTLDDSTDGMKRGSGTIAGLPVPAIAFLLLTLAVSLVWSHFKLMWEDEVLELWTDSLPSLAQVIHIQRTATIALEPIVYHILSHAAGCVFGMGAFAIRLPSLLGFLLMQVCMYFFVRRIASERAAIFALAFPALTNALYYSAEGRPYGLLLGWFGLAMVSWQAATRRESQRTLALITLALAVGLALNTHYYSVLLLIPLCGAELFRTLQRRRLDLPVLAAIGAGMACMVFTLPFAKAAAAYRTHFFDDNGLNFRQITQSYRTLFVDYVGYSLGTQRILAILLAIFMLAFVWGCASQLRSKALRLPSAEIVFLILLAALPVFGFLMAHYVTHAMQNRYILGAMIGIAPLLAIAMTPVFRSERAGKATLILLFIAVAGAGGVRIAEQRRSSQEWMASLILSPEAKAAVMASPTKLLYFGYLGDFVAPSYYEPDPEVRSRMALIYSLDQELLWCHMDTMSMMAFHASSFTDKHILPYESVIQEPGDHVFVLAHGTQEWIDQDIAISHAQTTVIGHAFGGDVVLVRFHP